MSQTELNTIHANCQAGTQAHGDEFYEPIMKVVDGLVSLDGLPNCFLLIKQSKHNISVQLAQEFNDAVEAGKEFVGEHYPADGCSTVPIRSFRDGKNGPEFHTSRSTSFGTRSATVIPVGEQFEGKLVL
jgi:hypothetical protein